MADISSKICNAVLDLIRDEEIAFDKIKISDIARRADIGKGTVYEYFKSKEQVIAEAMLCVLREFSEIFSINERQRDNDFKFSLYKTIDEVYAFLENNKKLSYMFFTGDTNIALSGEMKRIIMTEMKEVRSRVAAYFTQLFEIGKAEGIITGELEMNSIIIAVQMVLGSIMFYYHHIHSSGDSSIEFTDSIYTALVKVLS